MSGQGEDAVGGSPAVREVLPKGGWIRLTVTPFPKSLGVGGCASLGSWACLRQQEAASTL